MPRTYRCRLFHGSRLIVDLSVVSLRKPCRPSRGSTFDGCPNGLAVATAWGISTVLFVVSHPAPALVNRLHFLSAGLLLGLAYLLSGQIENPAVDVPTTVAESGDSLYARKARCGVGDSKSAEYNVIRLST